MSGREDAAGALWSHREKAPWTRVTGCGTERRGTCGHGTMSSRDLVERILTSLHACVLDDAGWLVVSGLIDELCRATTRSRCSGPERPCGRCTRPAGPARPAERLRSAWCRAVANATNRRDTALRKVARSSTPRGSGFSVHAYRRVDTPAALAFSVSASSGSAAAAHRSCSTCNPVEMHRAGERLSDVPQRWPSRGPAARWWPDEAGGGFELAFKADAL